MNKKLLLLCLLAGFSAIKADALPINEATSIQLGWQIAKNTVSYGIYPLAETATKASFNSLNESFKQNPAAFTGWSVAAILLTYQFGPSIWKWLKTNYRKQTTQTTTQSASQVVKKEEWVGLMALLNYVPFVR
jgi:hypothetical protein